MPNPEGFNGTRKSPPDEDVRPWAKYYFERGYKAKEIADKLKKHYDTDKYKLSYDLLRKKMSKWGLVYAKAQRHTVESIAPAMEHLTTKFPSVGSHTMKDLLFKDSGINVSRKTILEYNRMHHPLEVEARLAHRLIRKIFYCVGVNDIWAFDQHDKWRRFEIFAHMGMEPYSGEHLWGRVWWTNSNPRLTTSFYLDKIEELGGDEPGGRMPMLTQSDRGTENNGIANAQTLLRHRMDPNLEQTLQHKWMGGKRNIKPEIAWRMLRREWTQGFEDVMQMGLDNGWYTPEIMLERLVFQFVFIPWLQEELDQYIARFNDRKPRLNRKKVLPHGRPSDIFENPRKFGSEDFSIWVDQQYIDEVREKYAPPGHPVFDLVPPAFAEEAAQFYGPQGKPVIDRDNVWEVYHELLAHFESLQLGEENQMLERAGGGEEGIDVLPLPRPRLDNLPIAVRQGQHGPVEMEVTSDVEEAGYVLDGFTDDEEEADLTDQSNHSGAEDSD